MTQDSTAPLLLSLATLLAAAVLSGQLARRRGLPAVVGEILAGVLLGPTLLGHIAPAAFAYLFPATGPAALQRGALTTAGLMGFLFVAGLEMDATRLRGRVRTVIGVGACGVAVPFALGFLAVLACPALFASGGDARALALFVGTALSISALPVIARTLMDLGLYETPVGTLALAAATVDDVVGWSLFAFLSRHDTAGVWRSLLVLAVLIIGLLTLGRTLVRRARPWVLRQAPGAAPRLGLAAAATFGLAAVVAGLGLHPVLGAFLAGVVMSQGPRREDVHDICHAVATGILAPLYFVSVGLRVDMLRHFDLTLTLVVVAIACAGKIAAAGLAGRLCGLSARDSFALGAALNARGAMEILLAAVALEEGMIGERLYVSLVVMAVVTSVMAAPLLTSALRPRPSAAPTAAPVTAS
jgi:Kef-type K+ transport system membrane component KefB